LNAFVAFDFRSDLDRMDVLKTLPLSAGALAVGQLIAPTVVLSTVQWLGVAALALTGPRAEVVSLAVAVLVVPVNFLLFGLENLLFLLFPTRLVNVTPGDFQALGRRLLLVMLKLVAFGVVGGTTALAAVLV